MAKYTIDLNYDEAVKLLGLVDINNNLHEKIDSSDIEFAIKTIIEIYN